MIRSMRRFFLLTIAALGYCTQAHGQSPEAEDPVRTRREMREAMRIERDRWRQLHGDHRERPPEGAPQNGLAPPGWGWRPPPPGHWEGQEGRLTPHERRELRRLLDETARERRALASDRQPDAASRVAPPPVFAPTLDGLPANKGAER